MEEKRKGYVSLSWLALIFSLIPLGVDAAFLGISLLNYGNWGYLVLGLYILPVIHFLLGTAGLATGIVALVRKQRGVRTFVALALCGIYVILGCVLARFLFYRIL